MQSVKVVFHIDEVEKWPLLLANVRNLVKVVDVAVSAIIVLVNSKAVIIFDQQTFNGHPFDRKVQPNHMDIVKELALQGVEFAVCQNSLTGSSISIESLPEYLKVVPVGVLELIEKQTQGFAYIKP
jgi:uncharacterized protein